MSVYNDAGLSLEALKILPEIAAAVAEPLARAGTTTIISNGTAEGAGTGAAKLSEDVVRVMSQVTPLMKQLAGVDVQRMLQDISKMPGAIGANLARSEPGTPNVET